MSDAGFLELEEGTVPSAGSTGFSRIYIDGTDGHIKKKDDAGVVVDLEGAVSHSPGDYTASDITNVPAGNISSTDVQAAINELDSEKTPITHVGSTGVSEHGVASGVVAGFMSPTDKSKLDGIASSATANSSDAYLLARANHTGTQLASTISDFQEASQDAVLNAFSDSSSIDFTYTDGSDLITADLKNNAVTTITILNSAVTDAKVATGIDAVKIGAGSVDNTEFSYLNGVTSAIQTQFSGKANISHTHVAADVTDFNEAAQDAVGNALVDSATIDFTYDDTANTITAIVINSSITDNKLSTGINANKISGGLVSNTEFDYLDGVTSAIQTQFSNKQPLDSTLTSLAAYNTNGLLTQTAADVFVGRTLVAGTGISVTNGDGVSGNPTISSSLTANQTVDHSTVQIATAATSGLQGGGDITTTRNLSINIDGMTAISGDLAEGDELAMYDASASAHRKISLKQIMAQRARFTDQAAVMTGDFIGAVSDGLTAAVVAGTGASGQTGAFGINTTEKALGVTQIDTGTTATGRATLASVVTALVFGISRLRVGIRAAIEALSDGTDTFTAYIGFIDNTGAGDHTDGSYFRYTNAVNSGKWEAVTSKNSVRTVIDTGVTADTLYSVFEIEGAEDNASVKFYINGVLVATGTTNIPSGAAGDQFGFGIKIEKSVGITQRNMDIDWYYLESERSTAR